MMFFALMGLVTLAAWGLSRAGVGGLDGWPARMRVGMACALLLAGADHLATPERYLAMMPSYLPLHRELVFFTGLCEMAGAAGLMVGRLRRLAGLALAVYFVCVFPANINNALNGLQVDGLPAAAWYYWVRLAFQPLVIWWALHASGAIDWPQRAHRRVAA